MTDTVTLTADSFTKIGGEAYTLNIQTGITAVMENKTEDMFVSDINVDSEGYSVRVINSGDEAVTKKLLIYGKSKYNSITVLAHSSITLQPFSEQTITDSFESSDVYSKIGKGVYAIWWENDL